MRHRTISEVLLDVVPCPILENGVRTLQFLSGVSLLAYALASFNNFDLAYPWFKLGTAGVLVGQIIMLTVAAVQIVCGVFHCYRCTIISSWPAAVMFSYIALCAKVDDGTRYSLWGATAVLALTNWLISSVSSTKMKRDCDGRAAARGK